MANSPRNTADETPSPTGGCRWCWLLPLAPLVVVVASLTLSYLWNEDFWWYLSSGRAILQHGGIPGEDPFLYTSGEGGWVFHSWLWTVLVALLERLAGLEGVVLFHGLLAVALIALVYTTERSDRLGLGNALFVTLFLATIRHRLCGKAEVATWLMLALFYLLLERKTAFTWRRGAALGALQLLWANLHGGYPLGIFITLCYSAGGGYEARRGRGDAGPSNAPSRYPPLWFPLVLFLISVLDPRMFRERLAPFLLFAGSEQVQPVGASGSLLILEWRSPFSADLGDPGLPWLYLLAAGAGLLSFFMAGRWSLPRLFFFAGMACLGATAVRHLPGLSLAAALVGLSNLGGRPSPADGTSRAQRRRQRTAPKRPWAPWLYAGATAALAVVLLASAVALRIARSGFEGGQSPSFFAVRPATASPAAADFILEQDLPGPIFNDYQLGAYLSARLYPRHRLFIDSRVLDPSLVVRYTRIVESAARWRQAESRYGFRTAVLGNYSTTLRSPLGEALKSDPDWRLAFVDPLAVIFVKDSEVGPPEVRLYADGSEEPGVPFVRPPALVRPLAALQRVFLNDFPSNYLVEYLATLGTLGRSIDVVEVATRALETMPDHPLLLRQRCAARFALGRLHRAAEDCERSFQQRPHDAQVASLYGLVLQRAGRLREALAVLDEALRHNPRDPRLRNLRRSLTPGG